MDFFTKKIFERKNDDFVHLQFQKFSKGEFKDKAVVLARNSNGKYSISTTSEYANEFVRYLAEKLGDSKTNVTGIVVSTRDLKGELEFEDIKQFMGVKQYKINKEMSGKEIIDLLNKLPKSFFGLSFLVRSSILKVKDKAPKSAKPSTKADEKPKADFCKLKTEDKELVKNLIFDKEAEDFKSIEIKHSFIIKDLVLPKNEKDFEKIREMAIRKGSVVRTLNIDGKEVKKEVEFEV